MTLEEAQHVANVIAQADGGCPSCVHELIALLNDRFPQFEFALGAGELEVANPYDPTWPARYPLVTAREKVPA